MFISDYHTHSSFSSDSDAPLESMVTRAISLGLQELAITEHLDYDFADPEYTFIVDIEKYKASFDLLKEKYKGQIKLLFGLEMGLQPHLVQKNYEFLKSHNFDFVIASSHTCDRLDLYNGDFFVGKTQHDAYYRYFETVLENIVLSEKLPYNVYGHIDYINRYGDFKNKTLSYYDYKAIIDKILTTLISQDKGIEINSSGFSYGLGFANPSIDLLRRYKELGGKIITVGSDAHKPKDITAYFDKVYKALKECGFSQITLFEKQKPHFVNI